jgi:predicted nucleic acid-binding protein
MILLDTNVVSALMRAEPDPAVVKWLDKQPAPSIWLTSITVMEIRFGLLTISASRRRRILAKLFEKILEELIEGRIAPFDMQAGIHAADLMASRKNTGRTGDLRDTMIAGIALASKASLATRNAKHFADIAVSVVNPWEI